MIFGQIKVDIPEPLPHVTPDKKQQEKSFIRRSRKGTHKYNTRSEVNHVTTFKDTPQMFKNNMTDTSTTHIGSYYISKIDPQKYTITVEPVAEHGQVRCKWIFPYW